MILSRIHTLVAVNNCITLAYLLNRLYADNYLSKSDHMSMCAW